jgi:hypothetical protein
MSILSPALDGSQGRVAVSECRVWERYPCDVKASCQPVAARNDRDLHWPATLRDLSAKGVGIILGRRFEPGAGLAIELPETETRPADTLLARVIHVKALPGGRWLLGCSLLSELGVDELESIVGLGQVEAPPSAPRASEAPYQVVPEVLFRWLDAGCGTKPFAAQRLFLKGSWPLRPGAVVRVRRGDAPEAWLRVQVRSCAVHEGQWVVSCALVSRPSANVARSLGIPAQA